MLAANSKDCMINSKNNWNQDIEDIRALTIASKENLLLNEMIFARAISALEVFLVESIKDVFVSNPRIFNALNKTITIHYGEVLSCRSLSSLFSKILFNETHQLTRIGFEDVVKFYKKLNIEIGGCGPGKTKMLMYHEIRHLIIHRLGEVDNRFKKNYNFHKDKVEIDDNFLSLAITDFDQFVNDVYNKLETLLETSKKKIKIKERRTVELQVWFDRESRNEIINSDLFTFRQGDNLIFLKDILIKKDDLPDSCILTIKSKPSVINNYLERVELESKTRTNFDYKILRSSTQSKGKSKGSLSLSTDELDKIKTLVGNNGMSSDLKKSIAKKLGISNTQVNFAFQEIKKEKKSAANKAYKQ